MIVAPRLGRATRRAADRYRAAPARSRAGEACEACLLAADGGELGAGRGEEVVDVAADQDDGADDCDGDRTGDEPVLDRGDALAVGGETKDGELELREHVDAPPKGACSRVPARKGGRRNGTTL